MNTLLDTTNLAQESLGEGKLDNIHYHSIYDIPMDVWYSSDANIFYEALININDSACKTGLSQKVCSDALRNLGCIHMFCLRQVDETVRIEPKNEGSKPKFMKQAIIHVTVLERNFNIDDILKKNLNSKVSYLYKIEPSICIYNDRYTITLSSSNKAELVKSVMNLVTSFYGDDAVSSDDMSIEIDLPSVDTKTNTIYVSDWQKLSLCDKIYNLNSITAEINVDDDVAFDELRVLFEILYCQYITMRHSGITEYGKKVNIKYIDNSCHDGFNLNKQLSDITDNIETKNNKVQNILNRLYEYVYSIIDISHVDFLSLMDSTYVKQN